MALVSTTDEFSQDVQFTDPRKERVVRRTKLFINVLGVAIYRVPQNTLMSKIKVTTCCCICPVFALNAVICTTFTIILEVTDFFIIIFNKMYLKFFQYI